MKFRTSPHHHIQTTPKLILLLYFSFSYLSTCKIYAHIMFLLHTLESLRRKFMVFAGQNPLKTQFLEVIKKTRGDIVDIPLPSAPRRRQVKFNLAPPRTEILSDALVRPINSSARPVFLSSWPGLSMLGAGRSVQVQCSMVKECEKLNSRLVCKYFMQRWQAQPVYCVD